MFSEDAFMDIDTDCLDEAVLAILWLNLKTTGMAWKGLDWDAMGRLHKRGLISDPISKRKSVLLTEDGLICGERLSQKLFTRRDETDASSA